MTPPDHPTLTEEVRVLDLSPAPSILPSAPERALVAFVDALCSGDLAAAASSLARDACFLTPDATVIHGRQEIRATLAQLIQMRPQIQIELRKILPVGDVALSAERWTMRLDAADSSSFVRTSNSVVLLRRLESAWKLMIVAPWGFGGASAA
ncbi:MAG TPA: nuclear transport factor 2 family protein [Solirubrobacterales bacterium]|nr:nuclear transport factor 2 family protein [Solirubrobacterales bacterium]